MVRHCHLLHFQSPDKTTIDAYAIGCYGIELCLWAILNTNHNLNSDPNPNPNTGNPNSNRFPDRSTPGATS